MTLPVFEQRFRCDEKLAGEETSQAARVYLTQHAGVFVAIGVVVLAHVAPFPFLLDITDETVWRMPRTGHANGLSHVDDGPNPDATPQLLDVLARHGVRATFFVIDKHLTRNHHAANLRRACCRASLALA